MKLARAFLLVAVLAALLGGADSITAKSGPSAAMAAASSAPHPNAVRAGTRRAVDDRRRAAEALDSLRARYRYLDGVSVAMGVTPNDEQAVAYYTQDQIVISTTHEASIEKILAHEVWHIIDWRDNGRLDWGEDLPPINTYAYLNP